MYTLWVCTVCMYSTAKVLKVKLAKVVLKKKRKNIRIFPFINTLNLSLHVLFYLAFVLINVCTYCELWPLEISLLRSSWTLGRLGSIKHCLRYNSFLFTWAAAVLSYKKSSYYKKVYLILNFFFSQI